MTCARRRCSIKSETEYSGKKAMPVPMLTSSAMATVLSTIKGVPKRQVMRKGQLV